MTDRLSRRWPPSATSSPTPPTSSARRSPALRLRLEAAGLKTDDDALRRDLEAGEREAERLARTVTDLLTLAREGQRPTAVAPLALTAARPRPRSSAGSRSPTSAASTCELRDRSGGARVDASREDVAVILDNLVENAHRAHRRRGTAVVVELGAGRERRQHRRPRRRAGPGAGRGGARLRALRPRQLARRAPARQRPRPHDRARARRAMGRDGDHRQPARGRRPRAGPAAAGCRGRARPGRDAPPEPDRVVTTVMEDR